MLTDLQDLARGSASAPLWYDVIIVVWCSWTAMLLGVDLAVSHAGYRLSDLRTALPAGCLSSSFQRLSSFGIYIGRFVRLNSWDILQDPG